MSTKIILSCSSGVSSEVIANKLREAAAASGKNVIVEDHGVVAEAVKATSSGDVLLLSPQLAHMKDELQQEHPHIKVIVIATAAYSTLDAEGILKSVEDEITLSSNQKERPIKHIVMICTEGFSAAGIAKNLNIAAKELDPTTHYDIVANSASVVLDKKLSNVDLVLLAPGVEFMRDKITTAIPSGTPILAVDGKDYGTVDGHAIMKKALSLLK